MTSPRPHFFTIDMEDWFHVFYAERHIDRAAWSTYDARIASFVDATLDLLTRHHVRATFFIVGWIAEHHPDVVKRVSDAGHEIASHGYWHQQAFQMDREAFRDDITRSKRLLENVIGKSVHGYRAPGYSILRATTWHLDEVARAGYRYDSSVLGAADEPFEIRPGLLEVTPNALTFAGRTLPINGGFVFRAMPYALYHIYTRGLERQGKRLTFYTHTWEIESRYPRVPLPHLKRFIQYFNLAAVRPKLDTLLKDHAFHSIEEGLARDSR